ncbi:MAG: hypothetical protein KIT84_18850 [Labilithrix sp.]|nr:hypothetical protein [Labilithrix sp.]MCW5813094.1 hypothetical protein [Labilithrix sp.]
MQADVFQMQAQAQYGALVEGLRALKPKKRKPWAQWIVFAGCMYVLVALGADHQVRDALFAPKLPTRTPTSQQVVAKAQSPRQLTPVQAVPQVPGQVQQVAYAPTVPAQPGAQAPLVGMPLFATPDVALQPQVDPNADTKLPGAKAHHKAKTKRARGKK